MSLPFNVDSTGMLFGGVMAPQAGKWQVVKSAVGKFMPWGLFNLFTITNKHCVHISLLEDWFTG